VDGHEVGRRRSISAAGETDAARPWQPAIAARRATGGRHCALVLGRRSMIPLTGRSTIEYDDTPSLIMDL
jgi:hypothetical protein